MTRVQLRRAPAPDAIHRVLSGVFPGKRNDSKNESIWRIDNLGDSKALIVVSSDIPNLNHLVDSVGIKNSGAVSTNESGTQDKTIDYNPFLKQVMDGQNWNFRLCANPVEHRRQNPADKRGKIFALRTISEQIKWIESQGEKNGFAVSGCTIIGDSWIAFDKVRIRSVTFDGLLTVTNAEAFRHALTHGIGRGKAYGCGLLTVAKVQE
jgi:CRISPR system Cascade subunit CasE